MSLPHTAYADALHATLADAGLAPITTAVRVTDTFIRLTRQTVHDLWIELAWESGHSLTWHHVQGWYLHRPGAAPSELDLPLLVDPVVLIAVVQAALDGTWSRCGMPDQPALWTDYRDVDQRIAAWEDRS
ncbi:hypothetical protein U9R90_05470 [Streptomyces sp. E11-3]|uniref:hypothetical protein n=1 Tax=Streptomyces sp. E11-3 TaxID=3110112 RepID=UPI00398185A7